MDSLLYKVDLLERTLNTVHYHPEELTRDISAKAQSFRIQVLKLIYPIQTGHIGRAFSVAEKLPSLYIRHLRINPADPGWPDRDRLVFSKGHACAMLYTCMAYRGYFPVDELVTFRQMDSRLQGYPDRVKLPGVEICDGPLGHDIAIEWAWL